MVTPATPDLLTPVATKPAVVRWSLPKRILFRFGFLYLLLYCLPFSPGRISLLGILPFPTYALAAGFAGPIVKLESWVAIHLFHASAQAAQPHPTGSGDTFLDYVQVLCFICFAAVGAIVWSLLDRQRANYVSLHPWLRLFVRFTLALTLLVYGIDKIMPLQFGSEVGVLRLTETFGETSPMGLLWTFMAASIPYTAFCGSVEVGAGLLLLFRRTTALGALLAACAMANIFLLNLCYDVPVKLYSGHLLAMAVLLLLPEVGPLWRFLVLHQPAQLRGVWIPDWERRPLRLTRTALFVLVLGFIVYGQLKEVQNYLEGKNEEADSDGHNASLDGAWAASAADGPASRWQTVVFKQGHLFIRQPNTRMQAFDFTVDAKTNALHLNRQGRPAGDFAIEEIKAQRTLRGKLDGRDLKVTLDPIEQKSFLLTNRGFHWISEYPFNR